MWDGHHRIFSATHHQRGNGLLHRRGKHPPVSVCNTWEAHPNFRRHLGKTVCSEGPAKAGVGWGPPGSENSSDLHPCTCTPAPAPRKDGRTRSLPFGFCGGARGSWAQSLKLIRAPGLSNSQKGDRLVLSQWELETSDFCCVTWDSHSCLRITAPFPGEK